MDWKCLLLIPQILFLCFINQVLEMSSKLQKSSSSHFVPTGSYASQVQNATTSTVSGLNAPPTAETILPPPSSSTSTGLPSLLSLVPPPNEKKEHEIQKRTSRLLRKLKGDLDGYRNQIPGGRLTGNSLLGLDHNDPRRRRLQVADTKQPLRPRPLTQPLNTNGLMRLKATTMDALDYHKEDEDDCVDHICLKVENAASSDPRVFLTIKQIMEEAHSWDIHGLLSAANKLHSIEKKTNQSHQSSSTAASSPIEPKSNWSSYILRRWEEEGRGSTAMIPQTIINSEQKKLEDEPIPSLMRSDYDSLSDEEWQHIVADHFFLRRYQMQKMDIQSIIMSYSGVSRKEARRRCFNVPRSRPKRYRENSKDIPESEEGSDDGDSEDEEPDLRTKEEKERDAAAETPLGAPLKTLAPLTFVWAKFKQYPMWPAIVCDNQAYTKWQETLAKERGDELEIGEEIIVEREEDDNRLVEQVQAIVHIQQGEMEFSQLDKNDLIVELPQIGDGTKVSISAVDETSNSVDTLDCGGIPNSVLIRSSKQHGGEHEFILSCSSFSRKDEASLLEMGNKSANDGEDDINRSEQKCEGKCTSKKTFVEVFFFGDHTMERIIRPTHNLEMFDCTSMDLYKEAGSHHYLAEQFVTALAEVERLQIAMTAMEEKHSLNGKAIWDMINNDVPSQHSIDCGEYDVGDFVWARIAHYPMWPGVVEKVEYKKSGNFCHILFYGDNTLERVNAGRNMAPFFESWESFSSNVLAGWRHRLGGRMLVMSCEEALRHASLKKGLATSLSRFSDAFPPSDLVFTNEDERVRLYRMLCSMQYVFGSSTGVEMLKTVSALCVQQSPLFDLLFNKYGLADFSEDSLSQQDLKNEEQTQEVEKKKPTLGTEEIVGMLASSVDVELDSIEENVVGQKCVKKLESLAFQAPGRKNVQPNITLSARELRKLDARIARIEAEKLKKFSGQMEENKRVIHAGKRRNSRTTHASSSRRSSKREKKQK
eukprot:m.47668 g.47668  ORF g.47668 m.47668 type:complete len:989 (-) comp7349_c0_seq1:1799-4765(-)